MAGGDSLANGPQSVAGIPHVSEKISQRVQHGYFIALFVCPLARLDFENKTLSSLQTFEIGRTLQRFVSHLVADVCTMRDLSVT